MNIHQATREYEAWLAAAIPLPLVPADLDYKHEQMGADDPFPFFRATYYLWARRWAKHAGPLQEAPRVLAVGDIHLENFGTWRDADARLCWGVNDFDEVDELPYTHDLVRLAASVRFARHTLGVKSADGCEAILTGYRECLTHGGRPFVLEEDHPELRALATAADQPAEFWVQKTEPANQPPVDPPDEVRALLTAALPAGGLTPDFRARLKAGKGSLGRPRYVALAKWLGGWVCREAKAAAPPATAWATGVAAENRAAEAVERAVRSPDPFYRPGEKWVVRRLAPRSTKLELKTLKAEAVGQVLTAMGAEVANIHLGTPLAAVPILADLDKRPAGWLADAAKDMADRMEADWQAWRSRGG